MDSLEGRAWLGLIGIAHQLPQALDAQLQRDSELTHFEFGVLSTLVAAEDSTLHMTELARSTAATLPRLSHVCSRLEKRGLIERFHGTLDRRITNVRLTSAGRRTFMLAVPEHIALVRKLVIDALTPEQLGALAEITETISEQLQRPQH